MTRIYVRVCVCVGARCARVGARTSAARYKLHLGRSLRSRLEERRRACSPRIGPGGGGGHEPTTFHGKLRDFATGRFTRHFETREASLSLTRQHPAGMCACHQDVVYAPRTIPERIENDVISGDVAGARGNARNVRNVAPALFLRSIAPSNFSFARRARRSIADIIAVRFLGSRWLGIPVQRYRRDLNAPRSSFSEASKIRFDLRSTREVRIYRTNVNLRNALRRFRETRA